MNAPAQRQAGGLDVLEEDLIQVALEATAGHSFGASSALLTAGFTVLVAAVGQEQAAGAMRTVVDAITTRLAN